MEFRFGISPKSLTRWLSFQQMVKIQEQRGPRVGRGALMHIVDCELDAIARATEDAERDEEARLLYVRRQL